MITPRLVRYIPVVLFFLFILWIIIMADSATPSVFFTVVKNIPQGDKLGHLGLYGLLTALLNHALQFRTLSVARYTVQSGAVIVITFALLEEVSQYFFPNRTLDWGDVLADVIGISLFSYLSCKMQAKK